MKLSLLFTSVAVVAIASTTWLASSNASASAAPAPLALDYAFRDVPLNGFGLKNMADLRGKPVIIDFWGKN